MSSVTKGLVQPFWKGHQSQNRRGAGPDDRKDRGANWYGLSEVHRQHRAYAQARDARACTVRACEAVELARKQERALVLTRARGTTAKLHPCRVPGELSSHHHPQREPNTSAVCCEWNSMNTLTCAVACMSLVGDC
mmetsp:Transcript_59188/g.137838  ORF Transcript_59188/g.137838 Transcript_59188/m.137838 type:complete len:136 (-) Transcript_59188:1292-1699(-)